MQFNIKSWKSWARVIGGVVCCAVAAVAVYLGRTVDLDEHPTVEEVMYIIGLTLFVCLIVVAVVAGRQFSVTWARRLFWLNIISLILFSLMILLIWWRLIDWMPFSVNVKLIGVGALFPLFLSVCLWSFFLSFFFSWGMISRRTLRHQGFHVLFVATPPLLFFIWLLVTSDLGPLKPG